MCDASSSPTRPNPARLPLLLLIGLVAVYGYGRWIGGTGGLDPSRIEEGRSGTVFVPIREFFHFLHWMVVPALVLLAGGLIAGAIRAGPAGVPGGVRFSLGSNRPRSLPDAALFLVVCARVMAWGGLALGIAACGLMEFAEYREMHHDVNPETCHQLIITALSWAIAAPLAGILLGRVVFGALAEAARIRSHVATARVFSRVQDLAMVGLFVIPWYLFSYFTRWQ